ncbi:MAG: FAD-binding oxidoreductase [Actinomycetia bacterium]|nr:FAD-binding oxidoreductase [Actinomycetes bacterium]
MTVPMDGHDVHLSEALIRDFAISLKGSLIGPSDNQYDESRAIWNGMIDRRPALIARCLDSTDVAAAVDFARSNHICLSVRGGGHGVAGNAVCDDGLVIDLSGMASIDVDPERRTVGAGAGALLGDLDRTTQQFGLAVPAGTVSETGIAGLTLGGGMGWLSRRYGLTCDNLISVEMVTAGGEVLRADDSSHPDLMWGLRGGGGNFGIVTKFEYQAHLVGPTVLAGFLLHPIARAQEFFDFYGRYTADAPEELTTIGVIRIMPPVSSVPTDLQGVLVAGTGVCWSGDIDQGRRVLEPLRNYGAPLSDTIAPIPFVEHQAILDLGVPAGLHYYEKSENLPALTPDLIEVLVHHGEQVSSPYAFVGLFQLGGQVEHVAEDDAAYTQRDAAYSLIMSAGWEAPGKADIHTNWVRSFWKAVQPFSIGGGYINFMSHDDGNDRVEAAYGSSKYARLTELKNRYDPNNLFRLNQNIKPTQRV